MARTMDTAWALILVSWLSEIVTLIFWTFLPLIGVTEGADYVSAFITKIVYTVVLVLNLVFFAVIIFTQMREAEKRRFFSFYFMIPVFMWIWPTIGAWWWDSTFGGVSVLPPTLPTSPITPADSDDFSLANNAHTKWTHVLVMAAAVAFVNSLLAGVAMITRFEFRQYTKRA